MIIRIFDNNFYLNDIENIVKNNKISNFSELEKKIFNIVYDWINYKEYFLFKTSGSTGKSKEIKIDRKKILISIENTKKFLNLQKNMNCLLCISTDYIGGFMMLIRALEIGMNIHIVKPCSNPFEFLNDDVNFDFSAFVPLQIFEIIKRKKNK
ncbi:MAG: hypothetical protein KatS3mg068_1346 [Candidatus Sericytochromatia bacterium]|nr:MAG: hypothetical protein KatS3mg068_1346 [Candidatus Sericytochromatia bacterium]